ncbi:MAG: hypothetical protein NC218_09620 [Acetobacter sp.]|nr:hypothetical protein [Acetobacter sp.]
MNGEASIGESTTYAAGDHVHPTDTTRAAASDLTAHIQDNNNPHAVTKAQVGLDQVDNTSDFDKPLSSAALAALDGKVDKQVGKTLSSNDYTNDEKTKLANLENYVLPVATSAVLGGLKINGTDFAVAADGTLLFTGSGVGASAYEIAQEHGYTGTEAEWLESLKGANGTSFTIAGTYESEDALKAAHPTGTAGQAYLIDGSLFVWVNNKWEDAGYIQGPQGIQGIQGDIGPKGEKGEKGEKGDTGTSIKILGSYTSADALKGEQVSGELGDSYLVNGDLYVWNGTTWENVGNISGPKGDKGDQGEKGEKGDTGTSVTILGSYMTAAELRAAHPAGSIGQSYLVNGALYVWNGSDWEDVGYLQGPRGPEGEKGEKGDKGDTGTITIEQIEDEDGNVIGAKLTSGTTGTSAIVSNGKDGTAGIDGVSPSAKVEETDTGAIITVEDKNGTTVAEIYNGVSGSKGAKGDAGVGIASIAKTASTGNVDTYTITYTDNTTQDYSIINGVVIDKLSQLENDRGYLDETAASLLDNLLNYYKKEDLYNKEEIAEMMTNLSVGLKT